VVVLTDPDTASGFGLAGVSVMTAEAAEDAHRTLRTLIDDDSCGIIAVNEAFLRDLDERIQQRINRSYRPIVVSLPVRSHLHAEEDHRAYLARLVRRAVGFDITLRRG
jgi:V/A-type H+-transporting ATPase subunit F